MSGGSAVLDPVRSADPAGPASCPHLRAALSRIAVTLMTSVVAPAVLLYVMLRVADVATAVLAALGWMVAVMVWRYATGRAVSGVLLLCLGVLTVRTAFTLVTGNTFVYFVQPVFTDVAVAFLFLASLGTARPVIARLASDFYPLTPVVAAIPKIRALFRRLTLMWGLVILAKAAVTLWLLEALSTADFVLVKGGAIVALTATAAAVTIAWSYAVARQQGVFEMPTA